MLAIRDIHTFYGETQVLFGVSLEVREGEVVALLGPNGAGKTTLIGIVCGIVTATEGRVTVDGHDNVTDFRAARAMIGLVPQELTIDHPIFHCVFDLKEKPQVPGIDAARRNRGTGITWERVQENSVAPF